MLCKKVGAVTFAAVSHILPPILFTMDGLLSLKTKKKRRKEKKRERKEKKRNRHLVVKHTNERSVRIKDGQRNSTGDIFKSVFLTEGWGGVFIFKP